MSSIPETVEIERARVMQEFPSTLTRLRMNAAPPRSLLGSEKPHIFKRGYWYFLQHTLQDDELTRAAKAFVRQMREREKC